MIVNRARNPHRALWNAMRSILPVCYERDSRNGTVYVAPEPVTTVYEKPLERVVWWEQRDANPFFHLAESLWMLAGRNDVELPAFYVKGMRDYSDDGKTLRGAYGYRWRTWFGFDQIERIIDTLKENPDCRRQVLQMWGANQDLKWQEAVPMKDVPCNLMAHFQVNNSNGLDMTVFCRSNDAIWGAYGANAVHFSFLQEYISRAAGRRMGRYWQVSDNFHFYANEQLKHLRGITLEAPGITDHYQRKPRPGIVPLYIDRARFDEELPGALNGGGDMKEPFLRKVAAPMRDAYAAYKAPMSRTKAIRGAKDHLDHMVDCDWKQAGMDWLEKREMRWKEDGK